MAPMIDCGYAGDWVASCSRTTPLKDDLEQEVLKANGQSNIPSVSTPLRPCWKRSGRKLLKLHRSVSPPWTPCPLFAIDAEIPKLDAEGSNPFSRSMFSITYAH
jgi:hypothetical protein